jgi:LPXTG-motif cell wall-anchored protein
MSRRVVVLLVVLGVTVPYCALGAALWLSRGTGQTATPRFVLTNLVVQQTFSRHDFVVMETLSRQGGLFVVPARTQPDNALIALAVAGGLLLVLAAGFVFRRRRRRSDDNFFQW